MEKAIFPSELNFTYTRQNNDVLMAYTSVLLRSFLLFWKIYGTNRPTRKVMPRIGTIGYYPCRSASLGRNLSLERILPEDDKAHTLVGGIVRLNSECTSFWFQILGTNQSRSFSIIVPNIMNKSGLACFPNHCVANNKLKLLCRCQRTDDIRSYTVIRQNVSELEFQPRKSQECMGH
jgi:hypothetical protein